MACALLPQLLGVLLAMAPPGDALTQAQSPAREPPAVAPPQAAQDDGAQPLAARRVGHVGEVELNSARDRGAGEAELTSRAPALRLAGFGGLERFSAVAPSWSGDSVLMLDGAPLHFGVSGPVRLSLLTSDSRSLAQVYRSRVPLQAGAAAHAQLVELAVPLHQGPTRMWASAGLGSALTREAALGLALELRPRLSFSGRVVYAGSAGHFIHFDDEGTPLLFGDDAVRRRASNGYDSGLVALRVDHAGPRWQASSQLLSSWGVQEVPGPRGARPSDASLANVSLRSVSRARRQAFGPGGYIEWVANLGGDAQRFRDRAALIGPAADDERAWSADFSLAPGLRLPAWHQGWLSFVAQLRGQLVDVRDRASELDPAQLSSGDARRARFMASVGAQLEQWLYERRWALVPALHLNVTTRAFAVPRGEGEVDDLGRDATSLGFSPRLATHFVLLEGLTLRGSVGRHMRAPELHELFGDRGYARGNEGLRPESGTRVDGGLTLELEGLGGAPLDLSAQMLGYVQWTQNLIQWTREGTAVARPLNIERARLRGVELGAGLYAWERDLSLDLAYVLVDSANGSEGYSRLSPPIPGRPRHHLRLRAAGGHRFAPGPRLAMSLEARVFYAFEHASATIRDLSGFDELPARALHALGAALRVADRVELSAELRGLSARRSVIVNDEGDWPGPYPVAISDLMGYPLAGPSVWLRARVEWVLGP